MTVKLIVISGGMTSGKSVLAQRLSSDFGCRVVKTSDLIRSHQSRQAKGNRRSLQRKGNELDRRTDYGWIADEVGKGDTARKRRFASGTRRGPEAPADRQDPEPDWASLRQAYAPVGRSRDPEGTLPSVEAREGLRSVLRGRDQRRFGARSGNTGGEGRHGHPDRASHGGGRVLPG